jgi:hypothetical protein
MMDFPVAAPVDASTPSPPRLVQYVDRCRKLLRMHWVLALVLLAFGVAATWVDVLTPIATTDDWGYSRSVEILLDERRLTVFPVVAATAVFQILWGALFSLFFENTLGAVRLSTVVICGLSGLALYDICRRLCVSPSRSALVVAAYLFNPLSFVLSYSFMTDPHFTAVMVIATALTLRALQPGCPLASRWIVAGSVAAAAAILIRQQGVLIPLSIALFFLARGDIRVSWQGFRLLLRIGLIPAATLAVYLAWLRLINGVPDVQQEFASEIVDAGAGGSLQLVASLTFFELMYVGFFALPLTVASLLGLSAFSRGMRFYAWLIAGAWILAAVAGVAHYSETRRRMPYIPQFMGSGGLGPPDVLGGRPRLWQQPAFDVLTAVSLVSTILAAFWIARALSWRFGELRAGAGLVVAVLAGQIVGVVPPSFHYIDRGDSLDRYLLPILPLILVILAWALVDVRIDVPVGMVVALGFAVYAVIGTRDYLRYMDAVWSVAAYAVETGAKPEQVDAGAAWDGYHLYTYGVDQGIERARTRDGPWWTYFYGKASDSTYVVSTRPRRGYLTVRTFSYPSTLEADRTQLYLLSRFPATWPPKSADE